MTDTKDAPDPTKITITLTLYNELVESQKKLDALEKHGVDDWEWYEEAMSEYRQADEDE